MGSALLNTDTRTEFAGTGGESAHALREAGADRARPEQAAAGDELRAQVAERLAAHRSRRGAVQDSRGGQAGEPARGDARTATRATRIAAAVAERYAHTPSYRAVLAAEAERAIQQARAAAEVAAQSAQAIAAAQQRLLEAFDEHASREERRAEELARAEREVRAKGFAEAATPGAGAAGRTIAAEPHRRSKAASGFPSASELNLWPDLEADGADEPLGVRVRPERAAARSARPFDAAAIAPTAARSPSEAAGSTGGFTVRMYDDAASAVRVEQGAWNAARASRREGRGEYGGIREERSEAEAMALDEEIAFRHAPVFEEPAGPPVALPANLIEFPRQLVASRKARPRYAEGPLREEGSDAPGDGQLRIFEVDPAQISTQPVGAETQAQQWTSIWLDAPASAAAGERADPRADSDSDSDADAAELDEAPGLAVPAVQAASIARRVAACAANSAIVALAATAFAATFAATADRAIAWPAGVPALAALRQMAGSFAAQTGLQAGSIAMACAISGAFLLLLYHALFAWFSAATPGMRVARIALCTFDDENPTQRAIRWRMVAALLSVCPLGLGFVWAALDEERLTWHDRISRMYLRSY